MSYGVILYNITNDIPKILLIQRKESICYLDFMRGKYTLDDGIYIDLLFSRISDKEKEEIKMNDFDILWDKIWHISNKTCKDYINGKRLFNEVKKTKNLDKLLMKNYTDSEWEFPKGKRENDETNLECAQRELHEETNIQQSDYNIYKNIIPFSEVILGENNINYKNLLYFGYCKNTSNINIDLNNPKQIYEIKNVGWFSEKEAMGVTRDYHISKNNIIRNIFEIIRNYKNDLIVEE